jgi:hypothetical protein
MGGRFLYVVSYRLNQLIKMGRVAGARLFFKGAFVTRGLYSRRTREQEISVQIKGCSNQDYFFVHICGTLAEVGFSLDAGAFLM